ncbi:MAG: LytTR family DNA-binding domain-containing protein [Oscillospiraceae bacterium]|nr:LytTR family DNA-binding domain-containing protein [Oscillospiraceae bacterium]
MKIAICDDNPIDRELIHDFIKIYFKDKNIKLQVEKYENGANLIFDFQDGFNFDLVFLDIYMEQNLGIDVAKNLRNLGFAGNIVFVTQTADFAMDGYDVGAIGYILKPHSFEKIEKILDQVSKDIIENMISIKIRGEIIRIPINEIKYIESNNTVCNIHCINDKTYKQYSKLSIFEEKLNGNGFLRCHQSFLVNMNYIKEANKSFILTSGEEILIRQRRLKEIKDCYYNYINSNY